VLGIVSASDWPFVKWPILLDTPSLPVMEAVLTCLLTAMSLLAFLGLRYPVRLPNTRVGAGTDDAPAVASPTSRAVIAARAGCDVALISPGSSTADKDEDGHEHLQLIADEDPRRRPGEAGPRLIKAAIDSVKLRNTRQARREMVWPTTRGPPGSSGCCSSSRSSHRSPLRFFPARARRPGRLPRR
jgi:hypothetical protein